MTPRERDTILAEFRAAVAKVAETVSAVQALDRMLAAAGVPPYDPEIDQCAGGCARGNTTRRAFVMFHGPNFICPGCFEAAFGAPADPERLIDLAKESR